MDRHPVEAISELKAIAPDCTLVVAGVFREIKDVLSCYKAGADAVLIHDLNEDDIALADAARNVHHLNRLLQGKGLPCLTSAYAEGTSNPEPGSWSWHIPGGTFHICDRLRPFQCENRPSLHPQITHLINAIHPDDKTKIAGLLADIAVAPKPFAFTCRIISAGRGIRSFHFAARPVTAPGEEWWYAGVYCEVWNMQSAAGAPKWTTNNSELHNVLIGGWEVDVNSASVLWTENTYHIHDLEVGTKINLEMALGFYHPDDREAVAQFVKNGIESGTEFTFEKRIITAKGRLVWVRSASTVDEQDGLVRLRGTVEDITESRLQRDEILVKAALLDSVQEAAIAVDGLHNVTYFNQAAELLLGIPRDEAIHKPLHSLGVRIWRKPKIAAEEILFADAFQNKTIQLINRLGRRFHALVSSSVLRNSDGVIAQRMAIIRDVSEQFGYAERARLSEEKLRKVFQLSPVGKALCDMKTGRYLEVNQSFVDMLGYTREELANMSYTDITPAKYARADAAANELLYKAGSYPPYEKEYIRKDGSFIKVRITGFLLRDELGYEVYWTLVLDVSELEAKSNALKAAEERFRTYIADANDVIFTIENNGGISYVSPNISYCLGKHADEVTGTHVKQWLHPDDLTTLRVALEKAWHEPGTSHSVKFRAKHANGDYVWLQVNALVRKGTHGRYGIGIARNIDKEHAIELRTLEQNKRLREIAFVQSHILRRPLANILGVLALGNLDEMEKDQRDKLLKIIKHEAMEMDKVVAEIVNKASLIDKYTGN